MFLHDLNQAASFSDYIIALNTGHLVKAGSSEEVVTNEILRKVFNSNAVIATDPRTQKTFVLPMI